MKIPSAVLFACLAAQCTFAAETEFYYNAQNEWPGICTTGEEQSPINIITDDDVTDTSLEEQSPIDSTTDDEVTDSSPPYLEFRSWDVSYTGTFENTGHNVQFNPTNPGAATIVNQFVIYNMQQFHMHWGSRTGEGSEHRIDGDQAELEIHFVHFKDGETDTTQRDYITVVAVLGDVDEDAALTSPWSELDVTQIQSNTSSGISANVVFEQLLPKKRDYYYYPGSLTTPPCSETVQWFVLKDRISVPSTFLEQLRKVQKNDGKLLKMNFRMVQSLGDRVVKDTILSN